MHDSRCHDAAGSVLQSQKLFFLLLFKETFPRNWEVSTSRLLVKLQIDMYSKNNNHK